MKISSRTLSKGEAQTLALHRQSCCLWALLSGTEHKDTFTGLDHDPVVAGRGGGNAGLFKERNPGCPLTASLPLGDKPSLVVTCHLGLSGSNKGEDLVRRARQGHPWGAGRGEEEGGTAGGLQQEVTGEGVTPGGWTVPAGSRAALGGLFQEGEPGLSRKGAPGQHQIWHGACSHLFSLPLGI